MTGWIIFGVLVLIYLIILPLQSCYTYEKEFAEKEGRTKDAQKYERILNFFFGFIMSVFIAGILYALYWIFYGYWRSEGFSVGDSIIFGIALFVAIMAWYGKYKGVI